MTDRRRGPQPRVPLRRGRGLRHVPRPAGAAAATASVRGCRGRRSAPPAAFVCILKRGRLLAASAGSRAPARPQRGARAHSVATIRCPARMRRRGVGAGPRVTRTRDTNRSVRGLPRRPRPRAEQSLHPAGFGVPGAPSWTHPGRRASWGWGRKHPLRSRTLRADRWWKERKIRLVGYRFLLRRGLVSAEPVNEGASHIRVLSLRANTTPRPTLVQSSWGGKNLHQGSLAVSGDLRNSFMLFHV